MCCFGCLVVVLVTLFGSRDRGVWGDSARRSKTTPTMSNAAAAKISAATMAATRDRRLVGATAALTVRVES
jgi:hypothetical protein